MKKHAYEVLYDSLYAHYGPQGWWPAQSPLEMMVSAILVQNTNWLNVEKALVKLKPYLHPQTLLDLPVNDLGQLIRSSGFYNMKAKRIIYFMEWFETYDFQLDKLKKRAHTPLRKELLSIHGIGPETADVILLYTCDHPVFIVDAYARRIFQRMGHDMPKQYDDFKRDVEQNVTLTTQQFNEYHALIVAHAKEHCKAKPSCATCPLVHLCMKNIE